MSSRAASSGLFLLILTSFVCSASAQTIVAEAYLIAAEAANDSNDLQKSSQLYALALKEAHGNQHPELTVRALLGSATLHLEVSQFEEAEQNARAALKITERLSTVDPTLDWTAINILAISCYHQDRFSEAEALYVRLITDLATNLGPSSPLITIALNDLAVVTIALNEPAIAQEIAEIALSHAERHFKSEPRHYANCLDTLAQALHANGQAEEMPDRKLEKLKLADKVARQALAVHRGASGGEDAQFGRSLRTFAIIRQSLGNERDAQWAYKQSLELQKRAVGDNNPHFKETQSRYDALLGELKLQATTKPPKSSAAVSE